MEGIPKTAPCCFRTDKVSVKHQDLIKESRTGIRNTSSGSTLIFPILIIKQFFFSVLNMFTVLPELILTPLTGPALVKRSGKKERIWEANSSSFQGPKA